VNVPIETCNDGFSCVDRGGDALPECVGADPGTGVSYVGCTFVGGYDRVVIAKKDVARDLCFNVVLRNPGTATTGLTVPGTFGLEYSQITGAATCPSRAAASAITANKTVGTISWVDLRASSTYPAHASIDGAIVFAPKSGGVSANEKLTASSVDVSAFCP
jgi:hypothetical protein